MTHTAYNIIHYAGIFAILTALGGLFVIASQGDDRKSHPAYRLLMAMHGIGAFLILLAGFGMLARLGDVGFPGWVIAKVLIWIVIAGSVVFARKPFARWMLIVVPLLALLAALMATFKPF